MFLEVNRKASNVATKTELGRFPLQIPLMKRVLKYYVYLRAALSIFRLSPEILTKSNLSNFVR